MSKESKLGKKIKIALVIVSIGLIASLITNIYFFNREYGNGGLESQVANLHSEKNGLTTERDALKAEVDSLVAERNALATERDGLKTDVSDLVTERDNYNSQLNAMTSERDNLKAVENSLITERDALASERDTLKTEVNNLVTERDGLEAQVSTLTTEKNNLQSDLDSYQSSHTHTNSEYTTLVSVNNDLESQISTLEGLNEALKSANLIKVGMLGADNRPLFGDKHFQVTGQIVNVGTYTAYNAKLHVILYQGSVVAEETDINLGMIVGKGYVTIDEPIYYDGSAITSWSATPEWA